jgi:DNA-directed RNA polymerase specialized sigma24 family protein
VADDEAWRERPGPEAGNAEATPEDLLFANEFVEALSECLEHLAPRSRAVWFQRVFLEAPSRDIARRCGVQPGHVDVLVQRARTTLRQCMGNKGHGGTEARPGVFAALWPAMSRWSHEAVSRKDDRTDAC